MLNVSLNRLTRRLDIVTDDPCLHYFLETKEKQWQYIPWKKEWGYNDRVVKIYDPGKHSMSDGTFKYSVGLGWAGYLLGVFKDKLTAEDYKGIITDIIYADTYRDIPFPGLRDYQNEDVLFLLRYRTGLFQVNTGYGKTQLIATLLNYAHTDLGKNVLLVCPSNKARDELVKRCKSVFGLTVSTKDKDLNGSLDCIITSGLLNSKKTKDPALEGAFKAVLANYDWVLVDEVEYTINDAGQYIYDNCIGAERFYGFSGTADKVGAETITFTDGLSDVVTRNKDLIKYFGPSLIYRMPLNISIDNVVIKTSSLDNLVIDGAAIDESGNVYSEVMKQIWTDPDVCRTIMKVIKKFPLCFIPINNLTNILYDWIENYWVGTFRVLLVCGEGYIYYDLDGTKTNLTLQESCDYIRDGKVDVIPSTSSGYRALDFPNLENILICAGKLAGVTLQCVGRVARGNHMNIISLEPHSKRKIPVYSKGAKERAELINTYYQFCNLNNRVMDESEL